MMEPRFEYHGTKRIKKKKQFLSNQHNNFVSSMFTKYMPVEHGFYLNSSSINSFGVRLNWD